MDKLIQDIRYGFRQLTHNPGFSLTAGLALALGIGANSIIFSVVDAVVMRPLPYPQPDQLVMIWERNPSRDLEHQQISPVNWSDYKNLKQVFQDSAGWWHPQINLTDSKGEPVRVKTIDVTDSFFDVLGIKPVQGRTFLAGEDRRGAAPVVVIGYGLWQRRYGGDTSVIGSTIRLDGNPYQVVGIMPRGFRFPADIEVWRPLGWDPTQHSRAAHFFESVTRLAPGVTLEQAQAELTALTERWQAEFPQTNAGWSALAVPLHEEIVGPVRLQLLVMLAAVGFVLLIACTNVANLLLSRGAARQREIAVRAAIGAGRFRIFRQLLTESLVLSSIAGAAGLALAWGGLRLLVGVVPIDIPRLESASIDWRIIGFSVALTFFTAVVFGTVPSLRISRARLQTTLKDAGRGGIAVRGGGRVRGMLVVGEIAIAIVLLVGAALLIRSFVRLLEEDPGFRPENLTTVNVQLPSSTYRDWNRVVSFFSELLDRVGQQPGITSAGGAGFLPMEAGWRIAFGIPGRAPAEPGQEPRAQYHTVTQGYFETMGAHLLAGRFFDRRDDSTHRGAVIINQQLANAYWSNEEPVSKNITILARGIGPLARSMVEDMDFEIIGVVSDIKNNSLTGAPEAAIYMPIRQYAYRNINIVAKSRRQPGEVAALIKAQVSDIDHDLPISEARSFEQILSTSRAQPRFFMQLLTGFASLAMLLAALGIYGVLSYNVNQRREEIGIRMALGADRAKVIGLVLRQGTLLTACGVTVGIAGAFGLTRFMASQLHGVGALDLTSFATVSIIVMLVGVAACLIPARRATAVDPVWTLR